MRDVYLADIQAQYPTFIPRHDFDILALGDGRYKGPEKGIRAWLDQELALQVAMTGDARLAIEGARTMLCAPGDVTGIKPTPGEAGVFTRSIPQSQYSLRLFPGNPSLREYCLDFVETNTGRPVNSPFKFELWTIGMFNNPHVYDPVRLHSLESSFGFSLQDVKPGEEKFVLTDGMTCILRRRGLKPVRFTVPTRGAACETFDGYDIDLPQRIP